MPSYRKCIFPGCQNVKNSSVCLFNFPKDDEMKNRWIHFVKRYHDGELVVSNNTRLCSAHFSPESFSNFHQRQIGFSYNRLWLVSGAEPSVTSPPGRHSADCPLFKKKKEIALDIK
uniref:THAP domain-containing protein 1 n=1 Tax=Labrus bergylta TaxID=56723 RepID=A0A3Q3F9T4_9LABR